MRDKKYVQFIDFFINQFIYKIANLTQVTVDNSEAAKKHVYNKTS